MRRIKVPQLQGYGGAISANNSMASAFANLSRNANDHIGQKERERANKANENYKIKEQNFKLNKYNQEQEDKKIERESKVSFADAFSSHSPTLQNIKANYGDIPSKENANKLNNTLGSLNMENVFKADKTIRPAEVKPKYNLQKTNRGYVMFNENDPNAEPIPTKGNYKPYEKPKSNPSSRKTNEILNWLTINKSRAADGLKPLSFQNFFNDLQNTKKMGVGLRDSNSVKVETERVSKVLGLNAYQMSNYNFSKLNPQQKYEMDNLVITREQGLKSKVPDWMKKDLDSLSAVVYSSGQVSKSLSSNDTGLIDASLNKVNQYLGLGNSGELAKRTLTQSNYQLYSNFMLKSLSGLAVTKPEEARFTKAFGSLFMNDSVVATKIKTNMENLAFRLKNMKRSYDPVVFNYRYGHLQRNIDNAVQRMGSVIEGYNNNIPTTNQDYVNADGSNYNNTKEVPKTLVKKQKNEETGQIRNIYSDGSITYE